MENCYAAAVFWKSGTWARTRRCETSEGHSCSVPDIILTIIHLGSAVLAATNEALDRAACKHLDSTVIGFLSGGDSVKYQRAQSKWSRAKLSHGATYWLLWSTALTVKAWSRSATLKASNAPSLPFAPSLSSLSTFLQRNTFEKRALLPDSRGKMLSWGEICEKMLLRTHLCWTLDSGIYIPFQRRDVWFSVLLLIQITTSPYLTSQEMKELKYQT